jgi:type I restriction enzyme S subunit
MTLAKSSLSDLCALVTDGTHDTPKTLPEGIPLIKGKDISKGYIDFSACDFVSDEDHQKIIKRSKAERGDTLFANIGNSLGDVAFVETDRAFSIKNVALFKPNPTTTDPRYLFYLLKSPIVQRPLLAQKAGAAQPFLGLGALRTFQVLHHSKLETQRRISAILGAYDDLIEVNQRRVAVLEEMARGLFEEWFVRFRFPGHEDVPIIDTPDGPLPKGWVRIPLKSWCSLMQSGSTPPRKVEEYWQGGSLPWYTTGELWDGFLLGSSEQLSEAALKDRKAKVFEADTIFMAIYGSPTVGRMGITTERCSTNQAALGMRPEPSVCGLWFLYLTLFSLRTKFNSLAQGAAQQNISKAKVAETLAVQPPKLLADRFEAIANPMMRLRGNIEKTIAVLSASRDLLLPRLISGQLSVEAAERELEDAA